MCDFLEEADYHRKRHRDDDRHSYEASKRNSGHDLRKNSDHDSRPVISNNNTLGLVIINYSCDYFKLPTCSQYHAM